MIQTLINNAILTLLGKLEIIHKALLHLCEKEPVGGYDGVALEIKIGISRLRQARESLNTPSPEEIASMPGVFYLQFAQAFCQVSNSLNRATIRLSQKTKLSETTYVVSCDTVSEEICKNIIDTTNHCAGVLTRVLRESVTTPEEKV